MNQESLPENIDNPAEPDYTHDQLERACGFNPDQETGYGVTVADAEGIFSPPTEAQPRQAARSLGVNIVRVLKGEL